MDLDLLKSFARESRKELLKIISFKVDYVLSDSSNALRENSKAIYELKEKINLSNKNLVIEEIAYTWFNRFTALQYMDINGFNDVQVIMPLEGKNRPEILSNAIKGVFDNNFVSENTQKFVSSLLNGSSPSNDPEKEAYRLLMVSVCNKLHSKMPFLFEQISDYKELLIPDDLLSKSSIVAKIRNVMTKDICKNVEVIGWLYQFYISEKKDEIRSGLKNKKKIKSEDIPAATQLFTPHWIVKYLVENSLGRLWMLNNPNSNLINYMEYYISPEERETDYLKINYPEEIKICDPACGSGHILTYAFDLLYLIYEEEGYNSENINSLILNNNLYGIELDKRAGELSSFALIMKARERQTRFLENPTQPKICVLENLKFEPNELHEYMNELGKDLFSQPLLNTLNQFEESNNFGSLIKTELKEIGNIRRILEIKNLSFNIFLDSVHRRVLKVLNQTEYLSKKYHVVIANPPYMGSRNMNTKLSLFAKKYYPESKSDLYAMFMERSLKLNLKKGYVAMINMQSWMFLSSYEKLRIKLLSNSTVINMAHIGSRGFDSIGGEVVSTTAFVLHNFLNFEYKGKFFRLTTGISEEEKSEMIKKAIPNIKSKIVYKITANQFKKIPGYPIAYWVNNEMRNIFSRGENMQSYATPRQGFATGNNDKFLRLWYEVENKKSLLNADNKENILLSKKKWFPCNKGGKFRRWFGNNIFIVNWENNGQEIKNFQGSVIRNEKFYFLEGITWSTISGSLAMRYSPPGFLFETKGSVCFPNKNNSWEIPLAIMNTKIVNLVLLILSPTLDFHEGPIGKVPIIESEYEKVNNIANSCRDLAIKDWNNFESSWSFKCHPILDAEYISQSIELSYISLRDAWNTMTKKMMSLEKENNKIFIDAYGFVNQVKPDVPISEITLNCNPAYRYGDKVSPEVNEERLRKDTFKEFISYSVGCMFGRYSLEKPGLILANQGETLEDYLKIIPNPSFLPDDDNVIPVLELDWFEDDITARFKKFLKVTFGTEKFEENLRFIENTIGKEIRKYLLNDFYKDHIQNYKKRPIYWMFSSPKGSFNALIYMHRYQKDTIPILLEKYLREFLLKLRAEKNTLERLEINSNNSSGEKTRAIKKIQKIDSIINELKNWEKDVIFPLASQRLEIDLDDGVKINYPKFGPALKKISGVT